jgi:hypothetical protein
MSILYLVEPFPDRSEEHIHTSNYDHTTTSWDSKSLILCTEFAFYEVLIGIRLPLSSHARSKMRSILS